MEFKKIGNKIGTKNEWNEWTKKSGLINLKWESAQIHKENEQKKNNKYTQCDIVNWINYLPIITHLLQFKRIKN